MHSLMLWARTNSPPLVYTAPFADPYAVPYTAPCILLCDCGLSYNTLFDSVYPALSYGG